MAWQPAGPGAGRAKRYRRAVRLYHQGHYEQAVHELAPLARGADLLAKSAARWLGLAHHSLGLEALKANRLERAQEHLRSAVALGGAGGGLGEQLALAYARAGRFDRCADVLDQGLRCRGDQAAPWRKLAQAQWQAGQRAQAQMTLVRALGRLGDQPELRVQQGLFYAAEDRLAEARDAFAAAAGAESETPQAHYYLGLAAGALGDLGGAVRALQRALELSPDNLMTAYQLTQAVRAARQIGLEVVARLGEPGLEAARTDQLAEAIQAEPDLIDALLEPTAGRSPSEFNQQERRGLELLEAALAVARTHQPGHADLRLGASRVLERLGRLEEALAQAQEAVRINPHYAAGLVQLGRLAVRTGRPAQAQEHLRQAIARGADWPDVHVLLADLLAGQDRPAAREHLRRALELNPRYRAAAEALSRLAA